jgi:hypothetical protein
VPPAFQQFMDNKLYQETGVGQPHDQVTGRWKHLRASKHVRVQHSSLSHCLRRTCPVTNFHFYNSMHLCMSASPLLTHPLPPSPFLSTATASCPSSHSFLVISALPRDARTLRCPRAPSFSTSTHSQRCKSGPRIQHKASLEGLFSYLLAS